MNGAALLPLAELEVLYLAHAFLDRDLLDRSLQTALSPAAAGIRKNCLQAPAFTRARARDYGLCALASIMGAPDDAVRMAREVDGVTTAELARFPFDEVVHALGGTLRQRATAEEAWERELRRMQPGLHGRNRTP
ncbi:MAG TPA: hypothetical protein VNF92_00160 [Gemmatimonadaceae bacterium]|nr:hypothetical protein [Gemmatimonadaceae bacterium]